MAFLLVIVTALVAIFQDQPWLFPIVIILLAWRSPSLLKLWWWILCDPIVRAARRLRR